MATFVKQVDTLYTQESSFIFHGTVRDSELVKRLGIQKTTHNAMKRFYWQKNERKRERKMRGLEMFNETVDYSFRNERGWMPQLPVVHLHENAVIEGLRPSQRYSTCVSRHL